MAGPESCSINSLDFPPSGKRIISMWSAAPTPIFATYIAELLRAEREAPESFLAKPAIQEAVYLIAENAASNPTVSGTQVGAYMIGKQIGAGGMGTVYEAQDVRLNRKVAIKILPPPFLGDHDRIQRFRQEARAASLLNHPNIVSIYDAELAQGRCYIATEFVEGTTLRQLAAQGPMDLEALIDIAIQVCSALGAAHQAGIVHRDIKPENVMLRPDGIIKVLDFGLAKLLDPSAARRAGQWIFPTRLDHADAPRKHRRDIAISFTRTGDGQTGHSAERHLQPGCDAVRTGHRSSAFCGSYRRGSLFQHPQPDAGPSFHSPPLHPSGVGRTDSAGARKRSGSSLSNRQRFALGIEAAACGDRTPVPTAPRRPWSGATVERLRWWLSEPVCCWLWRSQSARRTSRTPSPSLTDKDTLVLTDFTNTTGDSVFDGALRQGLSAQLEQSPFLSLISDQHIEETLALMAQPKDARLTHELGREVCQRTAGAATIEGSIASLGSQYVLGLKAVNCHNGDLLAEEQETANGKEQVLKALGEAATKLRGKLGESLASVQKYDAPPENVTTSSLEALHAYSLGLEAYNVKNDGHRRGLVLPKGRQPGPEFRHGLCADGGKYRNLGEEARGAECCAQGL